MPDHWLFRKMHPWPYRDRRGRFTRIPRPIDFIGAALVMGTYTFLFLIILILPRII